MVATFMPAPPAPPMRAAALAALALLALLARAARAQPGAPAAEPAGGLLSANTPCRFAPAAAHDLCGLPTALANFQGLFPCAAGAMVGRPATLAEAQALVAAFPRAKASGVGHSWDAGQFCAGNASDAVNVVMTELTEVVDFITNPTVPTRGWAPPPGFPIAVDEGARTVTVAAGVPQRMLLDFLAEYRHGAEPAGWTLPAFSWFIDQTIGGAVATGTHGSTMRWGSLSSQVRGLKVVLANGTLLELADPAADVHLWRALGVSVGRLGVLAELTLRIVPQRAVEKRLQDLDFDAFAAQIAETSEAYAAAVAAGDAAAADAALFQLDETQAFWHLAPLGGNATGAVWRVDYARPDKLPDGVLANVSLGDPAVAAMDGPAEGVPGAFAALPYEPLATAPEITADPEYWAQFYQDSLRAFVTPGTFPARKAYLATTEASTYLGSTLFPYDQYEVAVPLAAAGACLARLRREVYGPGRLWTGFRTPALVRFVAGEDLYLSPTAGGPRMYVNVEDYVSRSSGAPNAEFQRVVELLRAAPECGVGESFGRLHWGKAGWPAHQPCFDGSSPAHGYGAGWCGFGCAVEALDPSGKFRSESDAWRWAATRGGAAVPLASCCSPAGFSAECACAPAPCAGAGAGAAAAKSPFGAAAGAGAAANGSG